MVRPDGDHSMISTYWCSLRGKGKKTRPLTRASTCEVLQPLTHHASNGVCVYKQCGATVNPQPDSQADMLGDQTVLHMGRSENGSVH